MANLATAKSMTFFRELYQKRQFIFDLGLRDFRSTYFGSTLGLAWAFIEPSIYVTLLYVFIGKVAKYQPSSGSEYLPWLVCGMAVWTFFSSTLLSGVRVFKKYSYLLKRWKFDMSLLPVANIIACSIVHLVFLTMTILLIVASGIPLTFFALQFLYYFFALCCLLLGSIWISASLAIFVKDVEHILGLAIQVGFWVSPIFWSIDTLPEKYHSWVKLNPIYYIINGYRESFLSHKPFWENPNDALFFWIITLVVLAIGRWTYNKLRPSFGDVLHG